MHVLGYSWQDFSPKLVCRTDGGVNFLDLAGDFVYKIAGRRCIGAQNRPCGKIIQTRNQCAECSAAEDRACLQCNGFSCAADAEARARCLKNDFCVYLASFGDLVKVGVSAEKRALLRWVEQGADYGVKIAYGGGQICRQIENKIAELGVRSAVNYATKIQSLNKKDIGALREVFADVKKIVDSSLILDSFQPVDLSNYYPQTEKMPADIECKTGTTINSRIIGAKGEVLFLEPNYSLSLKRLTACVLEKPDAVQMRL